MYNNNPNNTNNINKGLYIKNVTASYQNHTVLSDVNIHVPQGFNLSIIGKSGCGKSTLLNIIAGVYTPQNQSKKKRSKTTCLVQGKVQYNGIPVQIGQFNFMQQNDLLLPHLKIIKNIALPLRIRGLTKKIAEKKASLLLNKFSLDSVAQYYPSQLSGGMKQRVSLMRACVNIDNRSSNSLLLLDEPFASLDAITKQECEIWCKKTWESFNISVVLVTHDINEALRLSDYIAVLSHKNIEKTNPAHISFFTAVHKSTNKNKQKKEKRVTSENILQYLV